MAEITSIILFLIIAISACLIWANLRTTCTVWSFQEGLAFRYGKFVKALPPGRHTLWGLGYEIRMTDKQLRQLTVQSQEMTTADKAPIKISVVASYRIDDGLKYLSVAQMPEQILYSAVQIALREVIGSESIDAVLEGKSGYGSQLKLLVVDTADTLGMKVESIDVRDVILGGDLKKPTLECCWRKKKHWQGLKKPVVRLRSANACEWRASLRVKSSAHAVALFTASGECAAVGCQHPHARAPHG
ncbi:MAG: SPFH domain-containing protein [Verrucomicrobiales bacterium]